jgi:hypothetical protein
MPFAIWNCWLRQNSDGKVISMMPWKHKNGGGFGDTLGVYLESNKSYTFKANFRDCFLSLNN